MTEAVARNRQQQTALYGEPLGDLLGRVARQLGLNQARIAKVLGMSAPMLSQLMSAQRVKVGNPAAAQRLQALLALSAEAAEEPLGAEHIAARLSEIGAQQGAMSTTGNSVARLSPAVAARTVQALLRAVADAEDVLSAARLLDAGHPELAEFLRTYGAGRTDAAVAHYTARADLI